MNNVIMRRVEVTADYQPLADRKLVASVTLASLPTNGVTVIFRGDDGSDVPWLPGEWHDFWNVDLAGIVLKPNMVVEGRDNPQVSTPEQVAEATVEVLRAWPDDLAGVA